MSDSSSMEFSFCHHAFVLAEPFVVIEILQLFPLFSSKKVNENNDDNNK